MHEVENGLQSLHAQFRIAQTINQAGRIADIRKQNGKSFTLSTLGMKRSQDMLPGLIGCRSADVGFSAVLHRPQKRAVGPLR